MDSIIWLPGKGGPVACLGIGAPPKRPWRPGVRGREQARSGGGAGRHFRRGPLYRRLLGCAWRALTVNARVSLLQKVAQATVGIHAVVPQSHPSVAVGLGADRHGSGTIVGPDGLVITANYIVIGAQNVIVTLSDGRQLEAAVVAQDYATSIALLQVEGGGLGAIEPASSADCVPGEEVFMVASLGGEKRCADTGVISYLGPFDAAWEFVLDRAVCVTATSLNLGYNGGPLCNARGQMIGVSYLNFGDLSRAMLAIPAEYFIAARDELLRFGRRVTGAPRLWLGLLCYTLHDFVVIAGVVPGSPAEKAGLKPGDLVLAVDGVEIRHRRALYEAISRRQPGDALALKLRRNRDVAAVKLTPIRVEEFMA